MVSTKTSHQEAKLVVRLNGPAQVEGRTLEMPTCHSLLLDSSALYSEVISLHSGVRFEREKKYIYKKKCEFENRSCSTFNADATVTSVV